MLAAGPGQLKHPARHLAMEGRGIEVSFPGHGEVRPLQAFAEVDQAGHEVESGLNAGAQGDQAPCQPARSASTGNAGDVDTGLAAIARGHLGEPPAEFGHLRAGGPLLRAEDGGRVAEARRDVAGDDELDPPSAEGVPRAS